jgi:serine phosphatase RsbU (regulator of sigma subunit)
MRDTQGNPGPGTTGESLYRRVIRTAIGFSVPNRGIVDPELRRRARLLVPMALNLAVLLSFSAVLSTITTSIDPSSPYTLGWGGTAIIYLAAIGFWISWALSRSVRPLTGAWASIFTIYVFLTGFSLVFFDAADSLMVALAMPVLAGTVFLDVRGTLRLAVFSMILGLAYYPLLADDPLSWIYGYAILIAVLGLTLFLSLMREDDLAQLQRLSELERRDADRLRNEAELARTVQLAMLPTHLPEAVGVELAAYSVPAKEASGDFYDVFLVEHGSDPTKGSLVVVVCDVAGKGMASALVVSAARTALRSEAEREPRPGQILDRVNRVLHASMPDHLFLTAFVGVIDLGTGLMRFTSGGHPHPYHWNAETRELEDLVSNGLPVGLLEEAQYEEGMTLLGPGDVVIAFTDGLVEALNGDREIYGFDRVRSDVRACIDERGSVERRVDFVVGQMEQFVDGVPPEDDVAVVALSMPPHIERVEVGLREPARILGRSATAAASAASRG